MASSESFASHRPGPRRAPGAPSGPDEVRRAILDAAATLFAVHGVGRVSLRDIAAAADIASGAHRSLHRQSGRARARCLR